MGVRVRVGFCLVADDQLQLALAEAPTPTPTLTLTLTRTRTLTRTLTLTLGARTGAVTTRGAPVLAGQVGLRARGRRL